MKSILQVLVLVLFSSCASIMTGGTDDILVTSMPDGASFRTNLGQAGRTPMSISVPDDQPLSVSFSLDGYESQSANVGTRLSGWVLGNILFGGLIGLVVDITADGNVHKSDHVHADLVPLPHGALATGIPPPEQLSLPQRQSFEDWYAGKPSGVDVATGQGSQGARPQVQERPIVYVSQEKFHASGCRYLRQGAVPMDYIEASKRFTPCQVCRP